MPALELPIKTREAAARLGISHMKMSAIKNAMGISHTRMVFFPDVVRWLHEHQSFRTTEVYPLRNGRKGK